ncbi:MAG: acyl-CoA dehydrogenase family protein, partial [Acidimicrobiales bacterium]
GGAGLAEAAQVVQRLSEVCGSTAMVVLMHYAASAVINSAGHEGARQALGRGELTSLAFSEGGTRSQFWATQSTAAPAGPRDAGDPGDASIRIDARKSWVTSAGEADSYVWSTLPLAAEGPMTLWLVPADGAGISPPGKFDGLGLRGNGSAPLTATDLRLDKGAMLGEDGKGLDLALAAVLPWFLVLSGAFCVGLMEAVTSESIKHLSTTRLEHLDQTLVEQPITRANLAWMRVTTDASAALVTDTLAALGASRPDAMLRVLEVKANAGEAAANVADMAMKVSGGAAFRKELGIERRFRDSRAARVMAPTTDALLDFVGRAISGLPLLG